MAKRGPRKGTKYGPRAKTGPKKTSILKKGPFKTDYISAEQALVVGSFERYKVGQTHDEMGMVVRIVCLRSRVTVTYESGEQIILVNCPVELRNIRKYRPAEARAEITDAPKPEVCDEPVAPPPIRMQEPEDAETN